MPTKTKKKTAKRIDQKHKRKGQSTRTSWKIAVHDNGPHDCPGPVFVTYGSGKALAHVIGYEREPTGFIIAQAFRISAVPELMDAVQELAKIYHTLPEAMRANKPLKLAYWSAMKAIDKAEGAKE